MRDFLHIFYGKGQFMAKLLSLHQRKYLWRDGAAGARNGGKVHTNLKYTFSRNKSLLRLVQLGLVRFRDVTVQ